MDISQQENILSQKERNFINDQSRDIVLIHGLWLTSLSWEKWVKRFNSHGFNVLTPDWPGIEGNSVADLNKNPDVLRGLGLEEVVEHYEKIIRSLTKAPIIMGHSTGGVIVQLLLNKGLGCAGVAIDSVPTKGVLRLPFSMIKTAWGGLKNPFNKDGIAPLTFEQFKYSFANGLSDSEARMVYKRYAIPAPTRVIQQVAFANLNPNAVTTVDYENEIRPPLLFISGGRDHAVPSSVNLENANRYKTRSVTDYRHFSDKTHYILGEKGWEEIADFCLDWSMEQQAEYESLNIIS